MQQKRSMVNKARSIVEKLPGSCAGYQVIAALPVNGSGIQGHAIAVGKWPTSEHYATWEYNKASGFYWGHYMLTGPEAFRDAARRAEA